MTFILITLLETGRGAVHSVADGGLSKQADKLPRIPPLCLGTVESSGGLSDQTCQQWVSWHRGLFHTLVLSYFLASSSSLISFPFFTVDSYSFLSIWQGLCTTRSQSFCFNTVLFLCLGVDCSCPWVCRWSSYFDWFHVPLLLPAQRSAVVMGRPTNGPWSTKIYCRNENKNKVVSAISSARLHF